VVPIHQEKYEEEQLTPVLLLDCTLPDGTTAHWSTHAVTWQTTQYEARVIEHSNFGIGMLAADGADWGNQFNVTLVNTAGMITQLHRARNLKGSRLTLRYTYLDAITGATQSTPEAVYTGIADAPEELTTQSARLSFVSRFSLQRVALPQVRIQQSCPWAFPRNASERAEAVNGGANGVYSRFYPCGYSPDQAGGCGNLQNDATPYTSCAHTKSDCQARGMWQADGRNQPTARFGGFQFLPATSLVRGSGSSQRYWSQAVDGRARSNDAAPLTYGTARYPAPVIWAWSDGNYVLCEVLLGAGPINGVLRVWVNGIELPKGVAGADQSASGWYDVLTTGTRNGAFNPYFQDGQGNPAGDPHGSLAVACLHVPASMAPSNSLPSVEVLAEGLLAERFDAAGVSQGAALTTNPVWALVDLLRRCGWRRSEIDLVSAAAAATALDTIVTVTDSAGNTISQPRAAINYALLDRRPASDIVRGIRQAAELLLRLNGDGQIEMVVEGPMAEQQPARMGHSNATSECNGGWPSFEANDGSSAACTIAAEANGDIALRLTCEPTSSVANRLTVELQDARNDYLNGSLSLVDLDDVARAGGEIAGLFRGLGLPNLTQAQRVLSKELARIVDGNLYAQFTTSMMGLGIQPGDLITLTSRDYGLERAPFRVLRLNPGLNYETVTVLAQAHNDGWYNPNGAVSSTSTGWPSSDNAGAPWPIAGTSYDPATGHRLTITELSAAQSDGGASERLRVEFHRPRAQVAVLAAPAIGMNAGLTGGAIAPGDKALYYAVTAVDNEGLESRASAVIQIATGALSAPYGITLNGLVAPTGATLLRI
jgi:phage-related protein